MTNGSLVSIICPNFNKAKFLPETIQSVLDQSYRNWELLLLDDGSTDSSMEIIRFFEQEDSRVRFVPRPEAKHYGGSGLRNLGLRAAKGEFVLFLDSDDLISVNCLQQRVAWIKEHPLDLSFAVFPIGVFSKNPGDRSEVWRPLSQQNHLGLFLQHKLPWHTSSPIWQISFLRKLNGFAPNFSRLQDVELHTRALLHSDVVYDVCEKGTPDFFYRVSPDRAVYHRRYYAEAFLDSAFLYISDSERLLKDANMQQLCHLLKGTLLEALRQGLLASYDEKWSVDLRNSFTERFLQHFRHCPIYSESLEKKILIFITLHRLGAHRIRGFQRISKWWIL